MREPDGVDRKEEAERAAMEYDDGNGRRWRASVKLAQREAIVREHMRT